MYAFCGHRNNEIMQKSVEKVGLVSRVWIYMKIDSSEWISKAWIGAIALNNDDILIYGQENGEYRSFLYTPYGGKLECFTSAIVPHTSGYWCPAMLDSEA